MSEVYTKTEDNDCIILTIEINRAKIVKRALNEELHLSRDEIQYLNLRTNNVIGNKKHRYELIMLSFETKERTVKCNDKSNDIVRKSQYD